MGSYNSTPPAHEGAGRFLQQYARARGMESFCRHALWLLVLLGGVWLLIAAADWQVSLTQAWRLAAAIILYSAAIGWSMRFMLPLWLHRHSWREAALQVEAVAPALHGRLLATCELPCEADLSRRDSLAFREELHAEVSATLRQIQPQRLISWHGCRRPAFALLFMLLLWAGFSAALSPAWAKRLWARAAAPWQSLARIPGLVVTVESPQPMQAGQPVWIYAGESVRLLGRTNRPGVLRTRVQTRQTGSSEKSWPMRPEEATAFSTSFLMPEIVLEARVFADDAVSEWIRLEPAKPFRVESLTYALPETPSTKTKTTGAIFLPKPGEVSLEIHTDQPVKGQLELMQNQQKTIVPLQESGAGTTKAQFPVAVSGSYTLHLEDTRTGLVMDIPSQPIDLQQAEKPVQPLENNLNSTPTLAGDEEFMPEEPYGKRVRAYLSGGK